MKPTDAFSATDRIEFRRVEIKYEWDTGRQFSAVEVVINGVELSRRWQQATTRSVSPMLVAELGQELAPWGPYPPQPTPEVEEVPDGFAPVLTCSCGTFGCGGAYARIIFRPNTVAWHDFHSVTGDRSVPLGYFTFNRTQYEQARLAFTHSA